MNLGIDTEIVLLLAGLIFLLALLLGVWKYYGMLTGPDHLAHPYVDTAHRAALLYSFATAMMAAFVELSVWPTAVNLVAALVAIFFFLVAIGSYVLHGARRDTVNQFEHAGPLLTGGMVALIIGEIGGFGVLLAGFAMGAFGR